ncbi:MAG: response regulator transcription factor [Candidatus Pacebacteria bacterium]|nr:response regulator transcription factor [Candidatus Paceibacterota bacterium]
MKILIIEDDKDMSIFLKTALKKEGFIVDAVEDGETGQYKALTSYYDLLILDLNLPDKSGEDVCTALRGKQKDFSIIVLTGEQEINKKIELLNLGADDYMTKPFSFEELLARIRAVSRRPKVIEADIIEYKDLTIDLTRGTVKKNNKEIYLTLKEYTLLEFLIRNRGEIVSRNSIVDHVWDMNGSLFSNSIETHLSKLRKKLDKDPNKIIKTVPARGYKIDL